MQTSRLISIGVAAGVFALVLYSAWTYLQSNVDEHAAMAAGTIAPDAIMPEDHPDDIPAPADGFAEPGASAQAGTSAQTGTSAQAAEELGTPTSLDAGSYTRSDATGGTVTVDAALMTAGSLEADETLGPLMDQLSGEEFGILLAFNTHSVDLGGYDLTTMASLKTAQGEVQPVRWIDESEGSHHRSGVVVFPSGGLDLAGSGEIILKLRGVADVAERQLSWPLPLG
ncbi:MAG TPA: hypothetical protein VFE20_05285 [Thermoleophilia bacterium]|nr:hypothetical protein [Thermoleophilia bacterium]